MLEQLQAGEVIVGEEEGLVESDGAGEGGSSSLEGPWGSTPGATGPQPGAPGDPETEEKLRAFDAMVDGWLEDFAARKGRKVVRVNQYAEQDDGTLRVLCARCFSLRNHGWVLGRSSVGGMEGPLGGRFPL